MHLIYFRLPIGILGLLQTDENYLRRGYAFLVKKYISKQVAEMGYDVYQCVMMDNVPAQAFGEKLGFKAVG